MDSRHWSYSLLLSQSLLSPFFHSSLPTFEAAEFFHLEAAAPDVLVRAKPRGGRVGAGPAADLRPAMSGPIRDQ